MNLAYILGVLLFEDDTRRYGTGATGREGEETAVCTGGRIIRRSIGFLIIHFHTNNLER